MNMCGFVVQLSNEPNLDRERFESATDSLAHRGPDAAGRCFLKNGRVALGHRRLSILDLSSAANQPMQLGQLWVAYNGEIYNYPELKKELRAHGCVFRTHCDTEVLLHGYREWGEDLPNHLAGMFAFCLWDDAAGRLFGARDHAGQKPFYYRDANGFIAASEAKAIFALLGERPPMRRESLKEFLICDDVPDPYTWYEGVMTLPPGHRISVAFDSRTERPAVSEYWKFRPPRKTGFTTRPVARQRAGALVDRSVRMHQLADVEVGAFLSGGVDSSSIVGLGARQRELPLRTFSIGYDGDEGELPLARQVASMWKCHHTEARLDERGLSAAFDRSLDLFDMPFGDSSQFPTYEVAGLASAELKVVLTGDGGDEVFGGYSNMGRYMHHHPLDTSSVFEILYGLKHWYEDRRKWRQSYNFGHCAADNATVDGWLGPEFADLCEHDGWWFYRKHWLPDLDPFRRAQWSFFKCYLPTVLKKVDRCTMAHSLEARCPLLLPELIEFVFGLPTSVKNPRGKFKHLYRAWLRKEHLVPLSVLSADKQGFGVSQKIRDHSGLRNRIQHAIEHAQAEGWLSQSAALSAQSDWGCAWRMGLVGEALRKGIFT